MFTFTDTFKVTRSLLIFRSLTHERGGESPQKKYFRIIARPFLTKLRSVPTSFVILPANEIVRSKLSKAEVRSTMSNSHLLQKLDDVIQRYQSSSAYSKTSACKLLHFHHTGSVKCAALEELSLAQLSSAGAHWIAQQPSVGTKRIESLIHTFEDLYESYNSPSPSYIENDFSKSQTLTPPFERIAKICDHLEETLSELTRSFPLRVPLEAPPSPPRERSQNVLDQKRDPLQEVLTALREGPHLHTLQQLSLDPFWPSDTKRSSLLCSMTFEEIAKLSPYAIRSLPGVGESKIQILVQALNQAIRECKTATVLQTPLRTFPKSIPPERSERELLHPVPRKAVRSFYDTADQMSPGETALARLLKQMATELHPRSLAVAILHDQYSRHELGKMLGVSGSRISQIVSEIREQVITIAESLPHDILDHWNILLKREAVPSPLLFELFLEKGPTEEQQLRAGRILLDAIGAQHPMFFSEPLVDYWTDDPHKLEEQLSLLLASFPLTGETFHSRMDYLLPGIWTSTQSKEVKKRLVYVESFDFWATDYHMAVQQLLKIHPQPVTTSHIAKTLSISERYARELLKRISSHQ
jgi:hypothetical protein